MPDIIYNRRVLAYGSANNFAALTLGSPPNRATEPEVDR
jgi:hypothetical protein